MSDGSAMYKGGIISLGKFDEGMCFKLSLKNGKTYIICNPKEKLTNGMMSYIYRMFIAKKEGEKHEFDRDVEKDTNFFIDNQNFDFGE